MFIRIKIRINNNNNNIVYKSYKNNIIIKMQKIYIN